MVDLYHLTPQADLRTWTLTLSLNIPNVLRGSPKEAKGWESANCSGRRSDVVFRPDVFEAAMWVVVDDIDSPSHGVSGNGERTAILESSHRHTELLRFPRLNLGFALNVRRW